jgi:GT2 family glycosyltransferase
LKFSFIIASVDRYEDLKKCISSIENAYDHCNHEVGLEIFVTFKGKKGENKSVRCRYPDLTKFFTYENIGLSGSRNVGIRESSGDYLVFIDDDAKVGEDFIRRLSDTISVHSKINAFCGRLFDQARDMPFSVLFGNNKVKRLSRLDFQYFMGSAHVLSRAAVKKAGFYDERFGSGAHFFGSEETDMFFRLKAAGEQVLYIPELVFFHPIPDNPPEYVYRYSYAIAAALTKHCIEDKKHAFIYAYIILKRLVKAWIRILQKTFIRGAYLQKDDKYHYGTLVKGTFRGMSDFISVNSYVPYRAREDAFKTGNACRLKEAP